MGYQMFVLLSKLRGQLEIFLMFATDETSALQ